jgi:acyl-CoA thioesterase FadM
MLYAEAQAVMVWIDITQGKSRPLPDWMRKELGAPAQCPVPLIRG